MTAKQYLKNIFKNEEVMFIKDSKLYILEDDKKRGFSDWTKNKIKQRFQLNLKKGLHPNGQLITPPKWCGSHLHITKQKGVADIINNTPIENILRGEF